MLAMKQDIPVVKAEQNISKQSQSSLSHQLDVNNAYDLSGGTLSLFQNSDLEILNNKTNSMMEKTSTKNVNGKTIFRCKVCGKEALYSNDIKKHIEANHLEGVSIPCNLCENIFRSRNALAKHKHYIHKGNKD